MLAVSVDQGSVLFADALLMRDAAAVFSLDSLNKTAQEYYRNQTEGLFKKMEEDQKMMKAMEEEFLKNMTAMFNVTFNTYNNHT